MTSRALPACRLVAAALAAVAAVLLVQGTATAAFPNKPITIVVPFSAGGSMDMTARDLAPALKTALAAPSVVVENLGGAGGTVGAAQVAKAAADGYTLLFAHTGLSTSKTFYRKLPFDTLDDFEYLGVVSEVPLVLIGRPSLKPSTFPELVRWLKSGKERATIADAGIGSASHLCALLLRSRLRAPMTSIPYRGTGPAMSDVLSGHVDLMCDQTIGSSPQIEGGHVKAYAVASLARLTRPTVLNATPTLDESGLAGFSITIWQALYAPKGTPPAVVEVLNKALRAALRDPAFVARQEALGVAIVNDARLSPAGHKKFMESEMAKWSTLIKASGMQSEE